MPLEDLYHEKILHFSRIAREIKALKEFKQSYTNRNPICGDQITVTFDYDNKYKVTSYGHEVRGCVLCEASAGLLANFISGKSVNEMLTIDQEVKLWLKEELQETKIDNLNSFTPVKQFKNRHQCVILPFEAFVKACERFEKK